MTALVAFAHNAIVHGALLGAVGAAGADYHSFLQFHDWNDIGNYAWKTAAFRWVQGAVLGAVGAAGLGALLG